MANRHRGEGRLEADGQTYTLVYNTNALAELEDALGGAPFDEIRRRLTNGRKVGFRDWRALLWAGLRERHPAVSLREAGDLIDAVGLGGVTAAILPAFAGAFPPPPTDGDGRPPMAAGTGSASSS